MVDPDPYQTNTDPQPCLLNKYIILLDVSKFFFLEEFDSSDSEAEADLLDPPDSESRGNFYQVFNPFIVRV